MKKSSWTKLYDSDEPDQKFIYAPCSQNGDVIIKFDDGDWVVQSAQVIPDAMKGLGFIRSIGTFYTCFDVNDVIQYVASNYGMHVSEADLSVLKLI